MASEETGLDADDAVDLQRRLERALDVLSRTTDPQERRSLVASVLRTADEQLSGVECHLLPLVRRTGTHGEDLADAQVGHHTETKETLVVLRVSDAENADFTGAVEDATSAVGRSGRHLVDVVLPALRGAQAAGDMLDHPPSPRPHTSRGGGWKSVVRWWRRSRSGTTSR